VGNSRSGVVESPVPVKSNQIELAVGLVGCKQIVLGLGCHVLIVYQGRNLDVGKKKPPHGYVAVICSGKRQNVNDSRLTQPFNRTCVCLFRL
jgi:hypothetical protein